MNSIKKAIRTVTRPLHIEIRQFDEDISIDTFLWMLFKHYKINCVLDVGARFGEFGTILRNNGYTGQIISFEPVEENFAQLQRNISGDERWTAFHHALGSQSQTTEINVSEGTSLSSFLSPSDYGTRSHPGITAKQTEIVTTCRLDEIFEDVISVVENPKVYLKMDTQGWDLEVLRGAKGCLDKVIAIQSELSLRPLYEGMTDWISAIAEFKENGFVVSGLFAGWRDAYLHLSELDCVFVKEH